MGNSRASSSVCRNSSCSKTSVWALQEQGHLVKGFFQSSSHLSQPQGRVGMAGIPQRGSGDEQLDHGNMKTCLNKTLENLNTGTESPRQEQLIIPSWVPAEPQCWQLRSSLTFLCRSAVLSWPPRTPSSHLPTWQAGRWHCSAWKIKSCWQEARREAGGSWREWPAALQPRREQAVLGLLS